MASGELKLINNCIYCPYSGPLFTGEFVCKLFPRAGSDIYEEENENSKYVFDSIVSIRMIYYQKFYYFERNRVCFGWASLAGIIW